jgi:valyl-tRNA synthetase
VPEKDVMDTWMTSSLTPLINAKWADTSQNALMKRVYPMSVRPQAFEIIRTWLFYTVLKSHLHTKSVPWTNVMISGWGLDEKGRKISKSLGNFVEANKIIEKYSADALRYWSAGASLGHDLRYNESDVAAGRKIVVKLWNEFKFVASNLENADLKDLAAKDLGKKPSVMIDRWVLSHAQNTLKEATQAFEVFEFSQALRALERFFWLTYCDNYLEIVKDRFWSREAHRPEAIQSAEQTLYVLSRTVLKMFAPFMPFITEELWQRFFREREGVKSIHVASWPKFQEELVDRSAEEAGNLLLACLVPIR